MAPDSTGPADADAPDPAGPGEPRLVDAESAAEIGPLKPRQPIGELELIRHSGASAVVPILGDPDDPDPEIVLVRQFRYAAGGDIYEIPAGRPDRPGEAWEAIARRELEEETGYVAGRLRRLNTIYTTPGFTDERIHIFLATDLSEGTTRLDPDEFVEVVTLPRSDVMDAIRDGRIIDAKSVAGLLYYARFALG